MKKLIILLLLIPVVAFGNDKKTPSKIKEVTVYLSGAQITRTAQLQLNIGRNEISFTGLSPKIDESSIQISGLKSVSILSMAFDIDFLTPSKENPEVTLLESQIISANRTIAKLQNKIAGFEEEQKVIHANRLVSGENLTLELDKIKQLGTYYRERISAIKNEIFDAHIEINKLKLDSTAFQKQMSEINNSPITEHGVVRLKLDAPTATNLTLQISYTIQDAGWIPNYDIKSQKLNDPLRLTYKAHVYQKSGVDWENVKINLSSGSPTLNVAKPNLKTKYLDFESRYTKRSDSPVKKQKYFYNPTIKKVLGQVTDESGLPLPGVNILEKGTANGTTTDFDGYYTLQVLHGKELVFSYIGQKTIEVPIYSSVINTSMVEDAEHLDEVVVTAYGTSSNRIQGRAAGVQLRGNSSIGGFSRPAEPILPLYIIDGVPVDDFVEGDLDEDEIQSIEVLKGSNAEALYGARANNGVVLISTKKSYLKEGVTDTRFEIKKTYSIKSDGDITAIELKSFDLKAAYEHFGAPILNENVFMTATFRDWEQHNLLPGEANVYFEGAFAGKTTIDPYTTKKEMTLSLGIDPNITVSRKQVKDFKSKSFTGGNRILDRTYELVVKNNKSVPINIKLMDRVPLSQNKEIKVDDVETFNADYDAKKGLLTWKLQVDSQASKTEAFSFKVRYPKFRTISL
jgi:TonB-dependent SusC/RagA subfamily outer membrane receptor